VSFGFVFGFYFFEIGVKRIEFLIPELTVLVYPTGDFAQTIQFRLTVTLASFLMDDDHAALGENLDMLGDGGAGDVELFGNGIEVKGLAGYQLDDLAAGRIGYGLEYVSAGFGGHNG
jgi:hypothetical protein